MHAQLEREACEQGRREAVRTAHREEDIESRRHRAEAFGEMSSGKLDESGNSRSTGTDCDVGFSTLAPRVYRSEEFGLARQVYVMRARPAGGPGVLSQ